MESDQFNLLILILDSCGKVLDQAARHPNPEFQISFFGIQSRAFANRGRWFFFPITGSPFFSRADTSSRRGLARSLVLAHTQRVHQVVV